ncbi:hypothetical protein FQZ97_1078560 [compost metagenome]
MFLDLVIQELKRVRINHIIDRQIQTEIKVRTFLQAHLHVVQCLAHHDTRNIFDDAVFLCNHDEHIRRDRVSMIVRQTCQHFGTIHVPVTQSHQWLINDAYPPFRDRPLNLLRKRGMTAPPLDGCHA